MDGVNSKKTKLYALLVGINAYNENVLLADKKVRFPKLYGCIADTRKINDYLSSEPGFESHIKILNDENATKPEIVRLFKDHLGKAGKDDTAFFYFSGHGTQELADRSVFPSESDGRLESIACYFQNSDDDFLLADKELRWLIHSLSLPKPHIVTIFDCCHSGDNTRNGNLLLNSFQAVVEKRVPFVFPQRQWEHFIFSKEYNKEAFMQSGENQALPEGNHFQLSACESDESAVEISGEAVFTNVLLNVLNRSGGEISYYNLQSQVRNYMRNVYEQKPRFYVADKQPNDLSRIFLNKPSKNTRTAFGEVIFNENNGWQLNLGAIQGVSRNISKLKVFDPGNPGLVFSATIKTVNADHTELIMTGDADQRKVYRANVEELKESVLFIHFDKNDAPLANQKKVFDELFNDKKNSLSLKKMNNRRNMF